MNLKRFKIAIFTFCISLFSLCLFNIKVVQAANLPAKYNMNLNFNVANKTLNGSEEVNITNSTNCDLKNLVFHLYADSYNKKETMPIEDQRLFNGDLTDAKKGDISINKVLVNDKEVKFTQDNQILKMDLNEVLKNNDTAKVDITFTLKLPESQSRLGYMNDIYSLADWYPILSMYDSNKNKWDENTFDIIGESNYSDIADYNVDLTVPKNFVVASTGKETEKSSDSDTKVMNLNASNVRDFVIIMSPNFKVVSKEVDGIKVNSYYVSSKDRDDSAVGKKILDTAANAIKFFNNQFGKYPYDEFDIMETPLISRAMEYPQIIQMPMTMYNISIPAVASYILSTTVHEVAHQWWYVTVGDNEFKEPFLDESFATFSTAYYYEKDEGEYSQSGLLNMLYSHTNSGQVNPKNDANFPTIGSPVTAFHNYVDMYSKVIYGNGALLIEDLRNKVGDTAFLNIMQTYFNKYKFKNASINDFLGVIEEKSGKNVSDIIRADLSSNNYVPEMKLTDEQIKNLKAENFKNEIKDLEAEHGLVLGSLQAKVLSGEKAIIVTPSTLSDSQKYYLNFFVDSTLFSSSNVTLKKDTDLTDEDLKNNNLILLGNPWNNKVFNSMENDFPILVSKSGIYSDSFLFKSQNITGAFITKNPKNSNKLMQVLFWTKDDSFPDVNSDINTSNQFTINIDNKQNFNGKF